MNALDKAFIKAYAKGSQGTATSTVVEPNPPSVERTAAASQNRAAVEVARLSPLVEVATADGVWYRIEQAPLASASAAPAPHFNIPEPRTNRMPSEMVRSAVESKLSATEMLDSLLGLPESDRVAAAEELRALLLRVEDRRATEVRQEPSSASRPTQPESKLASDELEAFVQGAASSVVAQGWDANLAGVSDPESLCQCWVATEAMPSPIVVEQTWGEIAPVERDLTPASAPAIEAARAAEVAAPAPAESTAAVPATPGEAPSQELRLPAAPKPTPPSIAGSPTTQVNTQPAAEQLAPEADKSPKKQPETQAAHVAAPPPKTPQPEPRKPAPKAFQAAWEVDRLNWPAECDKLARGDAFGSVAKMLIETSRRGKKIVAVTGLHRGEGRTTLALCLARRVAKEGVRVALLDADFERPHLGRRIGIDMENGWDDVLTDGQSLAEAAVSSLEDNLTVLPLGRRAAAIVSAHTVSALQQASQAFDLVLVDMGPVREEEAGDSAADGASAAASLMVRDARHTTEDELAQALDRLEAAGLETLGVIETFT